MRPHSIGEEVLSAKARQIEQETISIKLPDSTQNLMSQLETFEESFEEQHRRSLLLRVVPGFERLYSPPKFIQPKFLEEESAVD